MGPLNSPGTTSNRFPIVTIGLGLPLAVSRSAPDVPDGRTDRQTDRVTDGTHGHVRVGPIFQMGTLSSVNT